MQTSFIHYQLNVLCFNHVFIRSENLRLNESRYLDMGIWGGRVKMFTLANSNPKNNFFYFFLQTKFYFFF